MAPPHWATSEQLKFLCGYISIFIEHTVKENQSKFWPHLTEDWFSHWPELNVLIKDGHLPLQAANPNMPDDSAMMTRYQLMDEEQEIYGRAIKTHKEVSIL